MLRFHAIFFMQFMSGLGSIQQQLRHLDLNATVDSKQVEGWGHLLDGMLHQSQQIGLRVVPTHIQIIRGDLQAPMTHGHLLQAISSTHDMLQAELSSEMIWLVPQKHVALFDDFPFGSEVQGRFPSSTNDIREAAKCLALQRNTAVVLHLMRVLEIGLNALAADLKIPFEYKNWEAIINRIPGRIKELEGKKRKPKQWRKDRQFYAEAGDHFALVKEAYRNLAMHSHNSYDGQQAREIFDGTKAFMRHLATRSSEKPRLG